MGKALSAFWPGRDTEHGILPAAAGCAGELRRAVGSLRARIVPASFKIYYGVGYRC